jgi:hypothetical protein
MSDITSKLTGDHLSLDEYFADFDKQFWSTENRDCWKVERRQTFVEQGSTSYDAFVRGDWPRALELLDERRPNIQEYYDRAASHGIRIYRARVVEEPISAYLIWQLNSLRQRSELGEHTRIIDPGKIVELERDVELPEIIGLGQDVVYQVIYGPTGAAERAIRSTDRPNVEHWWTIFTELYEGGEEMAVFFDRGVAGLRPLNTR